MSSKVKLTSCQKCTFRGGHDFITVQRPSTEPMKQHHSVSTYTVDGACKPAKSTHDNLSMLLEKWSFRRDIHSKALSQILKNKGTHCVWVVVIPRNYCNKLRQYVMHIRTNQRIWSDEEEDPIFLLSILWSVQLYSSLPETYNLLTTAEW